MKTMVITDHAGVRYFPAVLYRAADAKYSEAITTAPAAYEILNTQGQLYVMARQTAADGKDLGVYKGYLTKDTIKSIVEEDPKEQVQLDLVMSIDEAAEVWGLSDIEELRKFLENGRFQPNEARQSGGEWLISYAGMERVFGEKKNTLSAYSIDRDELYAMFFRIWLLDGRSWAVELTAYEKEQRKKLFTQVADALAKAYRCLLAGGRLLFKTYAKSGKAKVVETIVTSEALLDWVESLNNFGMNTDKCKQELLSKLKSLK